VMRKNFPDSKYLGAKSISDGRRSWHT